MIVAILVGVTAGLGAVCRFLVDQTVERQHGAVLPLGTFTVNVSGTDGSFQVDDIIGQQQVVIKSLEENFQSIDGIAGGTILGDGNVALIVDVQGLRAQKLHKNAA